MAGSQYEGFLKTPDENEYIPLLEHTTCIKRWDISPELRGAHDFAKYTRSKGIMTAVTHTEAEYDEIKAAYAVGFSHAAHFYNAMTENWRIRFLHQSLTHIDSLIKFFKRCG